MPDINHIVAPKAIEGIVTTDKAITKLDQSTIEFVKTVEKLSASLKKGGVSMKEINTAQKKNETSTKKLTELEKEQLAAEKALESQRKRGLAQMSKLEAKERELQAAIKKEVKSEDDLIKKTNALVAVRRKLDQSTDAGKKKHAALTKEIDKNTASLKRQDKQIGRSGRNVGNYGSALKGIGTQLMGALGLTAGVALFIGALKNMFGILSRFSQANATLAATLGKTREEIEDLTESAIEFAKVTKYTATEVSGLQNELAKLGFTTSEVKLQTGAVLDLAEATGADLAAAAKVTGIALKAYGLSAADSSDVVATLAIATTKSALSFTDYETALSTVGPVAASFGFSLEDTVALMGKLKDAGFDSSKASTALRNILLNLADSNGTLAKKLGGSVTNIEDLIPAMAKLKADGIGLNETLQLTDKRSVAAFNTLLSGADSVLELRDSITGANDALEQMVKVKTDNTVDAMARLGSAWEGVVLSFRDSEGFFVSFFDFLSDSMNVFTDKYVSGFDKYVAAWSFGLINLADEEIANRKRVLDEVSKMDEIDLNLFIQDNLLKAEAGDEFTKDAIQAAKERIAAIQEADAKALERKIQAEKDAASEIESIQSRPSLSITKIDSETTDSVAFPEVEFQKEMSDLILEELKVRQEKINDINQETADNARRIEEERIALTRQLEDEAFAAAFSIYQSTLDRKAISLNEDRERELEANKGNKEEQAKINARYDKEEAAIKTKKAKAEKVEALFSIAISTARAAAMSIATTPLPIGLPLLLLNLAIGAVQLAAVAAKPIPKFFKGTESAPGGLISVGEKGRELIETKSGELLMANQPTITGGLQGAKIYTNQETERIIKGNVGYDSPDLKEIVESNNRIERAVIKSRRNITIDRANRTITERGDNYSRKYMNAKIGKY